MAHLSSHSKLNPSFPIRQCHHTSKVSADTVGTSLHVGMEFFEYGVDKKAASDVAIKFTALCIMDARKPKWV
jgi:hypothetical protein